MFTSNAQWPEGTISGSTTTQDTHQTEEAAKSACTRLEEDGFGGEGKIAPTKTWVARETIEECEAREYRRAMFPQDR